MKDKELLYPELSRGVENYLKKIETSKEITPLNRRHVLGFVNACKSRGLSIGRQYFYLQRLYPMGRHFKKDFKKLTRSDVDGYMATLTHLGTWGRDAYVVTFQVFYRYLFSLTSRDRLPEAVLFLKRSKGKNNLKAEDLLSENDVSKMIEVSGNPKWRALIALQSEVGLRTGELRALRVGDIAIQPSSIKIHVSEGKMSGRAGPREVFVVRNYDAVKSWVHHHPRFDDPKAWLFEDARGAPMTSSNLSCGLKKIAKKAGIDRRVTTYLFRHTVATRLYSKIPTELSRRLMGHEASSSCPATYTHLNSDSLQDAIIQLNGMEAEAKENRGDMCPRCGSGLHEEKYKKALEVVMEMLETGQLQKLQEIARKAGS